MVCFRTYRCSVPTVSSFLWIVPRVAEYPWRISMLIASHQRIVRYTYQMESRSPDVTPALPIPSSLSSARKWSIYAGLYTFALGSVVAFLLSDLLTLFAEVVGLPPTTGLFVIASPTLLFGPVVWWMLVERPGSTSYLRGMAFGLLTALLTGIVWILRFVSVWGVEMLAAGSVQRIVGFVLAVVVGAGAITGLPIQYARRRSSTE